MQHANGMDAFSAFAQFSNTALGIADSINMEQARSEVRTANLGMQTKFNDYLLGLSGRNNFESFESDWENEKVKVLNETEQGLSSPYARKLVTDTFQELDAEQRMKIKVVTVERKKEWTLSNNQIYRNEILQSNAYTEDEKFALTQETLQEEYDTGLTRPAEYAHALRENGSIIAYSSVMQQARSAMESGDLEAAQKAIDAHTKQFVLADGKNMPMDEIKNQARRDITNEWNTKIKAMQNEHASALSEIYAAMLSTGNVNYAYKGLKQIQAWTGYNLDKDERDEYAKRFSDFLEAKDPKEASQKALETMIEFEFEKAVNLTFQGEKNKNDPNRGHVNAETGKAAFETVAERILKDTANLGKDGKPNAGAMEKYEKLKGSFFGEIEKRLPINHPEIAAKLQSIEKKSEDIALRRYGAKKVTELNENQRAEYDNLQAYLDGAMWDFLQSTNMATVTAEDADAVFENILTATLGKEMEILKKNPVTGDSGFKRKAFQSEDELAATYIKAAENPDLAYKDTFDNEKWVPGVKEGAKPFISWARSQIAKVTGVNPDEISAKFLETKGGKDIDAVSIFTVKGKQYKYTVVDKKPVLNEKTPDGSWKKVSLGTTEQVQEAKQQEKKNTYSKNSKTATEYLNANRAKIYANPMPGYTALEWKNKPEVEKLNEVEVWAIKDPAAFLDWIGTFKRSAGGGR